MPNAITQLFCISMLTTLTVFAQVGSGGGQGQGRPEGGQRRGPGQMMKAADTNQDGKVSQEEFLAQAAKRFTKMDRNGDGYLTKDDRPQRPDGQGQGQGDEQQGPPPDAQ